MFKKVFGFVLLLGLTLAMAVTVIADGDYLEERVVVLESMGIVLDYGDPIPISPLSFEEGMALWNEVVERFEQGESISTSDLPFPVIEAASISVLGEGVEVAITELDLDVLVDFHARAWEMGRSISFCGDFLDALKYAELYSIFLERIILIRV